ncbi:transporter [Caenimonas sp. SL110]|uniref:transporter n=1 Tax=Caenimonas sp. SL110 TaxID=1450524 RepID=UPI0006549F88|nr:transporter [Caenimonas sp. SL110]
MGYFSSWRPISTCGLAVVFAQAAFAADGFKLRYPLAGSLGAELLAPADRSGWFGNIGVTHVTAGKLTDDTGERRQQGVSGPFVAPIAGQTRTASFTGVVDVDARQEQSRVNLVLGYRTGPALAGGRWAFAVSLPYTLNLDRTLALTGSTPTLTSLQPAVPAAAAQQAQAGAQASFDTAFQADLATRSARGTFEGKHGLGDMDVALFWQKQIQEVKVAVGASLGIPTGEHDPAAPANIGFGRYVTLRPSVLLAYSPNDVLTVGSRLTVGLNSRNTDSDIRSGNFVAIEAGAALRTSFGAVGSQLVRVQQFQDDSGGIYGANRFRSTGIGVFYTVPVRALDLALTLQYMKMLETRNAQTGAFYQMRLSKQFH